MSLSIVSSPAITTLRSVFTPDPDDAFAWWAIATGRLELPGFKFETSTSHIQEINEACLRKEYEIAAVSSAAYPKFSKEYAILSAGASVGRGYGPALASKKLTEAELKAGAKVGIPGELTTGALLLRMYYPGITTITLPFDKIAGEILNGNLDAGVLIHEELLNWKSLGLKRIACLGNKWFQKTGLPLPVGLNVVRKDLGRPNLKVINHCIRESMELANKHSTDAQAWAMKYSRQAESSIGVEFIRMFANDDTMEMDADCRKGLYVLYVEAVEHGLLDCMPEIDII